MQSGVYCSFTIYQTDILQRWTLPQTSLSFDGISPDERREVHCGAMSLEGRSNIGDEIHRHTEHLVRRNIPSRTHYPYYHLSIFNCSSQEHTTSTPIFHFIEIVTPPTITSLNLSYAAFQRSPSAFQFLFEAPLHSANKAYTLRRKVVYCHSILTLIPITRILIYNRQNLPYVSPR